jgi:hypothetical protein
MAATPGNQFWKLRCKHGRDKIFSTPEILWECCKEYFEATDKRKWVKTQYNGKDAIECKIPNETPYTWTGLYLYLDIGHQTWVDYEKRQDFMEICTRVRNIIYTQKFEGAAVGAFHAMIVSRDLGLTERTNNTNVTEQPLFNTDTSD